MDVAKMLDGKGSALWGGADKWSKMEENIEIPWVCSGLQCEQDMQY